PDHRIRADDGTRPDPGVRMDDRGLMDLSRHQGISLGTMTKLRLASAAILPLTKASPRTLPERPPAFTISTRSSSSMPGFTGLRNLAPSMPRNRPILPAKSGLVAIKT